LLEESIADRLSFSYSTFIGNSGNKSLKQLDDNDIISNIKFRKTAATTTSQLTINDVTMSVHYERGEFIEEDVNCDSTFMLKNIRTVGEAIRKSFHWVSNSEVIFLHMDNAGGHGTVEAIAEYTEVLQQEFNIQIVHQIPRFPETNILDLGICAAFSGPLMD